MTMENNNYKYVHLINNEFNWKRFFLKANSIRNVGNRRLHDVEWYLYQNNEQKNNFEILILYYVYEKKCVPLQQLVKTN